MTSSPNDMGIDHLTVQERLDLIALIWDSLDPASVPVPDWHREELDRRQAAADANPAASIPWEELKRQLREES